METIDLKAFRKANKISQLQLAECLGVGQPFISQIEKGLRPLPKEYISKLSANKKWDTTMLTVQMPSTSQKMIHGLDTSSLLRGMKITSAHVQDAVNKAAVRVVQPEGKIVQSYLEQKVKDLDAKIAAKDELINQLYEQIGMLKAELNLAKEGKV